VVTIRTPMTRRTQRAGALTAAACALALLAAACGGSGGGSGATGSASPKQFTYLTNAENTTIKTELATLAKTSCAAADKALPLTVDTVPQTNLDQKLQLLAGQNALPVQFAAGSTPQLTATLDKAGDLVNFQQALSKLGVLGDIQPAAISTIKSLYGGKFDVLPYELNIEGIFYNRKLFASHGVAVPQTWDQLVAAAARFKAAGIIPFSASGQQGWPITRLISGYLFRELGPGALQKVADGQAKLTDPAYVKAAQAVAALGAKGYFGQGVGSIDYNTSISQFLTGKAAMLYMGSWALANVPDPKQDTIGAANVGFMPFPMVPGGRGNIEQYPANVGLPMTMSAKLYGPKVGAWLKCIAQNYGSAALKHQSVISGFRVNTPVTGESPLAQAVQSTIAHTGQTVLWFEALFNAKATTTSQTNAAPLVSGSISPQQFMSMVQAGLAGP
jgi:raffinose/stachyose/melibiose transport system substrate-binding protein